MSTYFAVLLKYCCFQSIRSHHMFAIFSLLIYFSLHSMFHFPLFLSSSSSFSKKKNFFGKFPFTVHATLMKKKCASEADTIYVFANPFSAAMPFSNKLL